MLNALIQVARGLLAVGVLIFIVIGAFMGGAAFRGADNPLGYAVGAVAGFFVASLVFGVVAAIFDMQRSLRLLARIIHEKCAIKAKPLISLTAMRMGCLMKFLAMKSLAQGFGGLGRFGAVR